MADNATKEDLKKLVSKDELKNSLKDFVRKNDIERLLRRADDVPRTGLKGWLNANWVGVLIAFFALLLSIYSGYETRRHQRLSVRPHVTISFNANDDGAGWVRGISGTGPAIINGFEVKVDGKPVQTWDAVLITLGVDPRGAKISIPTPGTSLLPGENAVAHLLWVPSPASRALVKGANRVQMTLTYCSLYDECWERSDSARELEPKPVPKRKPAIHFGVSKLWSDLHSRGAP
jgi:hypothetical protein